MGDLSKMTIPIFIITRDRVSVLKQSIASYMKLGNIEVVIHDNNSTYPPMIEYLKELESQGIKVYRYPETTGYYAISELVKQTIDHWYCGNDSEYYIVTDPDIELDNPSPAMLEYFIKLHKVRHPIVVAPMLRIDDLPDCFHFKDQMINSHMEQFWGTRHRRCNMNGIEYISAPTDTTFGMYKNTFKFRRLNQGIRVHKPYTAKHLDWYIDTKNLSEEQQYYVDHAHKPTSTMSMHIEKGGML